MGFAVRAAVGRGLRRPPAADAPIGDSRSKEICERAGVGRKCGWFSHVLELRQETEFSATLGTPPRCSITSCRWKTAHFEVAFCGSYGCPVFHRLHNVEAMARATLRRAFAG